MRNILRSRVYTLIDGERDYQESRWSQGRILYDREISVAEWVIFIRKHLVDAEDKIYNLDKDAALVEIRKITALGVACMENNETRSRSAEELVSRTSEVTNEEQGDGK